MSQANQTFYINVDHLLSHARDMNIGYMYVGDGNFLAVIKMGDVGEQPVLGDSGLLLYRGPAMGRSEPQQYIYTFHSGVLTPAVVRKVSLMHWFSLPLGLLGRGPNRPLPWIDEHPFYRANPVDADILLQTNLHPGWNRIKPLTNNGLTWVRSRSESPDSNFTLLRPDGTSIRVPPKDYGLVVDAANADGLSVWVY